MMILVPEISIFGFFLFLMMMMMKFPRFFFLLMFKLIVCDDKEMRKIMSPEKQMKEKDF